MGISNASQPCSSQQSQPFRPSRRQSPSMTRLRLPSLLATWTPSLLFPVVLLSPKHTELPKPVRPPTLSGSTMFGCVTSDNVTIPGKWLYHMGKRYIVWMIEEAACETRHNATMLSGVTFDIYFIEYVTTAADTGNTKQIVIHTCLSGTSNSFSGGLVTLQRYKSPAFSQFIYAFESYFLPRNSSMKSLGS